MAVTPLRLLKASSAIAHRKLQITKTRPGAAPSPHQ
jgi:hypothetical protein